MVEKYWFIASNTILTIGAWYMYCILETSNVIYFLGGMYCIQTWVDKIIEKRRSDRMVVKESRITIESIEDVKKIIKIVNNSGVNEDGIIQSILSMFATATGLDSEVIDMAFGNITDEFYGTAMSIEDGSRIIFKTLKDKELDEDMGENGCYKHNGLYILKSMIENVDKIERNIEKIEELEDLKDTKEEELSNINKRLKCVKEEQVRLLSGE